MRKCTNIFTIYEEVISHNVYDFAPDPSEFPNIWGNSIFFFISVAGRRSEPDPSLRPLCTYMTLWCLSFPCLENVVDFFESQKLDGVYRPVHVVPVVGEILLFLKGPKHENFGSRFLSPSKPIWLADLRRWRRNELYSRIGGIFGENCIRRMLSMPLMF
jgi:hypothetical protein